MPPDMIIPVLFSILSLANCNYFGNTELGDQCFCKLRGSIDDCGCSVDTVDYFNNVRIYPRLQSLLVRDYFRFYRVNLLRKCPFWTAKGECAMRHCSVQRCLEADIPDGLKGDAQRYDYASESPADKYSREFQSESCGESAKDHDRELGFLNTTISSETYREFQRWQRYDDAQDNFCVTETSPGEYVDLLLNPERYTGYKGESARVIWRSIYLENCFRPDNSPHIFIRSSKVNGMCLEKRAFYRAISGLHASINIHLSAKYPTSDALQVGSTGGGGKWGPNLKELTGRFSPETTGGEGPNWLKNLYFIYLLELRALEKAAPYLEKEEYYTGNDAEDADTRMAMNDILSIVGSFPDHFNESVMFNGGAESQLLKEEFRQHFRNISRIMDCVGCDKCKLWGKLQIQGLGTALKILFSGKFDKWQPTVKHPSDRRQFFLERSEIVALINAFGRLSESIFELEKFRKMMR